MKVKTKFKDEFRRQMRLAIAAAIGFIIAYSWRDFVVNLVKDSVVRFSSAVNAHLINLVSSLIITIFGVVLILFTSKMLKKK